MPSRVVRRLVGKDTAQQNPCLFDHLVGAREQRRWHFVTERLGGLEIDHQLELRRLLDRQFCRVGPFENFIYESSGSFEVVCPEGSKSRSAVVSCLGDRHVGTPSTEGGMSMKRRELTTLQVCCCRPATATETKACRR